MQKSIIDFVFLSFVVILMITIGGKTGTKVATYFLTLVLLSMIVMNKDKVNEVLSSINSNV